MDYTIYISCFHVLDYVLASYVILDLLIISECLFCTGILNVHHSDYCLQFHSHLVLEKSLFAHRVVFYT